MHHGYLKSANHPLVLWALLLLFLTPASAWSQTEAILVQSTTSTANSGLYKKLLPQFEKISGIQVNVVAVGTGQAINNARNCDADVLLVHAKSAEQQFVDDGFGVKRFDLMYNDFIVVGPGSDPAMVKKSESISQALTKIAQSKSLFASRGDNSGTHKKERALWSSINIDPAPDSGTWYRETGSGMGTTLNVAVGMRAYVVTDRATWISFKNKNDFEIVFEGDAALFNQYGVILVSQDRCPTTKAEQGQQFIDWLLSKEGQTAIAEHKIANQQLFFPNAARE